VARVSVSGATVLADNPLAYYRLGEPSGSTMADATGNHGGSYVGAPALGQAGISGGGGDTDMRNPLGGGAYGQVSGWLTVPGRPASVEAWIKHDGSTFLGMNTGVTIA